MVNTGQRRLRVHDNTVCIRWNESKISAVVQCVVEYLGLQAVEYTSNRELSIEVCLSGVPAPNLTGDVLHFDNDVSACRRSGEIILSDGSCYARILADDGDAARVFVPVSLLTDHVTLCSRLVNLLVMAILIQLRRRGLYTLHAAALEMDSVGVLLVADRDCGKSTLAYSLVREGWRFLSDDSVLLLGHGSSATAVPFRRTFGLDPEAEDMFPELVQLKGTRRIGRQEKRSVPVSSLYASQMSEESEPRLLIFPEIVDEPASRICSIGMSEALLRVIRQSAYLDLEPQFASDHLALLRTLIHGTRHLRLFAGQDVKRDPTMVAKLLGPILQGRDVAFAADAHSRCMGRS